MSELGKIVITERMGCIGHMIPKRRDRCPTCIRDDKNKGCDLGYTPITVRRFNVYDSKQTNERN